MFPTTAKDEWRFRFISAQEVGSLFGSNEAGVEWPGLYRVEAPIVNEMDDIIPTTSTKAIIIDVDHIEGSLGRLRGSTKQYVIESLNVIETGIKKVKVDKYLSKL